MKVCFLRLLFSPLGVRLWQDEQTAGIPTGQMTSSILSFLLLRLYEGDGCGQYLDKCVFKVILTICFLLHSLAAQCFFYGAYTKNCYRVLHMEPRNA